MGFRGQEFVFGSPAAAVAGMIACLRPGPEKGTVERVTLESASGRILAEDARADRDSPAFDHSAMDGYAAASASLTRGVAGIGAGGAMTLRVAGESRIGCEPPALPAGMVAVRIATGAPMPAGADTVIRREDVEEHGADRTGPADAVGEVSAITLQADAAVRVRPGDHIRRRGENASAGRVVLHAGETISAAGVGTLAAAGVTRPVVFPRVRIALVTTGDELVDPEGTPSAFQVRNSNGPAVRAILSAHAWADVAEVMHVRDDGGLCEALTRAGARADALILTGGVSMGHRDPVRAAVEGAGAEILFHGLPQRPGKPMLGAALRAPGRHGERTIPIFGLPGNPVSAMVTCIRIVLPVLAACAGARRTPPACQARLIEVGNPDGRTLNLWWHRPVRLVEGADGLPRAELVDGRGSGDVVAAGMSDGFIEVPPGGSSGGMLPFYAWPAGAGRPVKDVT